MKNFAVLTFLPVLCLVACAKVAEPAIFTEEPPPQAPTSLSLKAEYPVEHCDIFIFEASGLRRLQKHFLCSGADTTLYGIQGDLLVAAIANCPGKFNDKAAERYDLLENFIFPYCEDRPDTPLMSATGLFAEGEALHLELTPLLCRIELSCIESYIDIYNMLAYLENVNASAEPLRQNGFVPSSMLNSYAFCDDDSDIMRVPSMLWTTVPPPRNWRYDYRPGISLYCYPNEGDDGPGSPASEIVLEAESEGEALRFHCPLGKLPRGCCKMVEFKIKSHDDWSAEAYP